MTTMIVKVKILVVMASVIYLTIHSSSVDESIYDDDTHFDDAEYLSRSISCVFILTIFCPDRHSPVIPASNAKV